MLLWLLLLLLYIINIMLYRAALWNWMTTYTCSVCVCVCVYMYMYIYVYKCFICFLIQIMHSYQWPVLHSWRKIQYLFVMRVSNSLTIQYSINILCSFTSLFIHSFTIMCKTNFVGIIRDHTKSILYCMYSYTKHYYMLFTNSNQAEVVNCI